MPFTTGKTIRALCVSAIASVVSLVLLSLAFHLTPLTIAAAFHVGLIGGVYTYIEPSGYALDRLAVSCMIFVGLMYFWSGVAGLVPNGEPGAVLISSFLTVPPQALYHALAQCALQHACDSRSLAFPLGSPLAEMPTLLGVSIINLCFSGLITLAFFLVLKKARLGRTLWASFVAITSLMAIINLIADSLSVHAIGPAGRLSPVGAVSLIWTALYLAIYLLTGNPAKRLPSSAPQHHA